MKVNKTTHGLALAGLMIGTSIALAWASRSGLIAGDIPIRVTMALSGLVVAFYGNVMPKALLRSERARFVRRFAGWAFVLSGLASAVLWTVAPIWIALVVGTSAIGAALALTVGLCVALRLRRPAPQ